MNLNQAIKNINQSITKKQPETINPQWIKHRCKVSYKYLINNFKNEFGEIDWDFITAKLDRRLQGLWLRRVKRNFPDLYEDKRELDLILNKYSDKLYLFLSQSNQDDRSLCDQMSIRLVRLSQKGNILAKKKLLEFVPYIIDQWIEGYRLKHWRGYDNLIIEHLEACIRRYRYSGSFLGYLFRTLEYCGRALRPLESFSLNQPSQITERMAIDRVVKDVDTDRIIIYG